jgi:hypothetical protein
MLSSDSNKKTSLIAAIHNLSLSQYVIDYRLGFVAVGQPLNRSSPLGIVPALAPAVDNMDSLVKKQFSRSISSRNFAMTVANHEAEKDNMGLRYSAIVAVLLEGFKVRSWSDEKSFILP